MSNVFVGFCDFSENTAIERHLYAFCPFSKAFEKSKLLRFENCGSYILQKNTLLSPDIHLSQLIVKVKLALKLTQ